MILSRADMRTWNAASRMRRPCAGVLSEVVPKVGLQTRNPTAEEPPRAVAMRNPRRRSPSSPYSRTGDALRA